MWFKADRSDQLYDALKSKLKVDYGDYISGLEQFIGPGWYWLETRRHYFGNQRGHPDGITMAILRDKRIAEITEKMRELAAELREARQTTRH